MDFTIEKIDKDNYFMFEDLTFIRKNGREKTAEELALSRKYVETFKTLANENLHIFAAKVGNKFVGYVSAVYIPKVGSPKFPGYFFIDELWTRPEYRRLGIAFSLMMRAEEASRKAGAIGMRLYTGDDNISALALYRKCGYKNLGSGAVFMEKEWDKV
ncbi:MAG: GNAT family N-acetyltransferase [Oscillospiraceae bacterium]|nr:GNAT family N-acetyltransferase [Oscillospiraceae bacterium]